MSSTKSLLARQLVLSILFISLIAVSSAQQQELPLLEISALEYKGGFRLPTGQFGDNELSSHSYSTGPIAFNPANKSLFTVSHDRLQAIGEFSIPSVINSDDPTDYETASVLQNFREFHQNGSAPTGIETYFRITGLALVNSKLVVNYMNWYDAAGTETDTSVVFQTPTNLANSDVIGPFQLDGAAHASGWLTPIPNQWQTELGGDYIAGHAHGSIIGRLSVGPPAHALNVEDLTSASQGGPISTTALLDFSLAQPLYDTNTYDLSSVSVRDILYNEDGQNDLWTQISGCRRF